MGAGIAFVAARAGFGVALVDPDGATRAAASARIAERARKADSPEIAMRVAFYETIPEPIVASLAIEAVPERLPLKRDVFARLERALPADAVLATNTSSLSVAHIAQAVQHPERVIGLHFFNPPEVMKLVEIVVTDETADATVERARAFVERIERFGVEVADTPGFIVNRVARPYYLQSMRAVERNIAALDELDALARGIGFRMGPFELMDVIGLDVNLATTESVYERTGSQRLAPVEMQRHLVASGRLGKKTQWGFYDYRTAAPAPLFAKEPDGREASLEGERICVVGLAAVGDEFAELFEQLGADVRRALNDDELYEASELDATIVLDCGDGTSDRADMVKHLDSLLAPECALFVDAYTTDTAALARSIRHPERLIGFGVLGSFERQQVVEIVDTDDAGDDMLELAQELFEALGRHVVLVEPAPALFLGRVVASIVNEAVIAVAENVASADDVDLAMRHGTNYPIGPIAWGREIGGARVARILSSLAAAEGAAFAPHRSLWVLDVDDDEETDVLPATGGSGSNPIVGGSWA